MNDDTIAAFISGLLVMLLSTILFFFFVNITSTDMDTTFRTLSDNGVMYSIEEARDGMVSVSVYAEPGSVDTPAHESTVLYPDQMSEWFRRTTPKMYDISRAKYSW